ncbi:DUF3306 domain-containing protein [uncultured Sphaerotilus sp.]|uniref:DUF3306 domain-containing protein n=1 Tax=uncultured Sphaerotilus sp. TaxID=474984 RepID=UPI0030CA458F
MATEMEPEGGFLSRWSRRKVQVRQGDPVAEVPPASAPASAVVPLARIEPASAMVAPAPVPAPPAPTLADAAQLTPASDFTRFVARGVDPSVKNAALKTLFTDPHFNVMDGLDTYIEDYGLPDPIPLAMLRQMTQSKVLGLFADEENEDTEENPADENTAVRLQPDDAAGHGGDRPDAGADAGSEPGRAGDDAHPAVPA